MKVMGTGFTRAGGGSLLSKNLYIRRRRKSTVPSRAVSLGSGAPKMENA